LVVTAVTRATILIKAFLILPITAAVLLMKQLNTTRQITAVIIKATRQLQDQKMLTGNVIISVTKGANFIKKTVTVFINVIESVIKRIIHSPIMASIHLTVFVPFGKRLSQAVAASITVTASMSYFVLERAIRTGYAAANHAVQAAFKHEATVRGGFSRE
jgi:hypothetical protein